MAYDIDNSLIVRGTPEAIADLKDLISRYLDIPPKQVSIKAEFIEVSTSDVNRLGIDWQIERLNKTFSTAFNPSGNVVVGIATGNVAATLRTELTTGKGRVVNSPIISTLNNTPAYITIGKYIPYWTTTYQASTTTTATTSTMGSLPVQTYLFVLPRVNGDNSITLYLEPTVQDTGAIYKGPNGEEFPETRNQSLRANRRIMNGETIVVGGFIRRSDSDSTSEVPLLGRLPIIGGLFRSTSRNRQESELLIFLTPTIIPEKGGTTLGVVS
jgi:general secretion pathway protein D